MASNQHVVEAAFADWAAGERPITDLFAEDMTWEITGRSVASRRYRDRAEFVDDVLVPFGRRFSTDDPFRPVHVRAVLADESQSTVVVLWDGRGTTVTGSVYENTYAWVMRMSAGLVVDAMAFFDSIAFDELWRDTSPMEP